MGKGLPESRDYFAQDRLIDGKGIVIRAIRPDDKPLLQEGLHRLSKRSIYFRFFAIRKELSPQELVLFTELDFVRRAGLLAVLPEAGIETLLGVGRYIADDYEPSAAELAFVVAERFQGRGVATALLKQLVMSDNVRMSRLFTREGFKVVSENDGLVEFRLDLSTGPG
ncbi:MAG: GNAT family N-acetyltransferase [Elusimicrobia bacterium]|nr:GNAT family N-acetyltransferase [Elusimicrobiota bacterium]